jgi:uncharacterized repeat protein (TIGR03806 family)
MTHSMHTNGSMSLRRLGAVAALFVCVLVLQACGRDTQTAMNSVATAADTAAPSIPQDLQASATSAQVALSWMAAADSGGSGLGGYRIYRDSAATPLATTGSTQFTDTSVAASASYVYVVRAVDGAGNESEPSNPANVTTASSSPATVSGLDARTPNLMCLAWERSAGAISLARYTELNFTAPIAMVQAPGVTTHWYVAQQNGLVVRFAIADPTSTAVVLDLTQQVRWVGEGGLLGIAFHPNFPSDPRVFLAYTMLAGSQLVSHVSSFTSSDNGATLNADSEVVLLTVDQPADNHNGGHLAFGPDGLLYVGLGDGGGGGDQWGTSGNGQSLTTLLGKLLRIDVNVDAATRYAVPASNPYFNAANSGDKCLGKDRGVGACPEIYAWGLRNPWRYSFDRANGDLWLADVGQNAFEEVNRIVKGGNYGWRCREGAHDFASGSTPACAGAATIDPLIEYGPDEGQSIIGGYVYRGTQATTLVGRYLFGDFVSGRIWAWLPENTTARAPTLLLESGLNISSFAQGNDGELYVLDHTGGTLQRIFFQAPASAIPTRLSATGCVAPNDATQPASGMIAYDINAPFWSDGTTQQRWMGLPDGQTISVDADGDWQFPNGTVLMQSFRNATRLIETRLFMRHPDGTWGGFSYAWNAKQTDATLITGGTTHAVDGQTWIFPSEAQCVQCHSAAAGRALGLETAQLNKTFRYSQTNRTANQLVTLSAIGALAPPLSDAAAQPALPDLQDANAPLANRARAYLHTNCAQCHRPNGPTPSPMDLRYGTALSQTNACNATPQFGDLGLASAARLIAPGSAANSIVVVRAARRDAHGMPPVGSAQVDAAGVALLTQWIDSLTGC